MPDLHVPSHNQALQQPDARQSRLVPGNQPGASKPRSYDLVMAVLENFRTCDAQPPSFFLQSESGNNANHLANAMFLIRLMVLQSVKTVT